MIGPYLKTIIGKKNVMDNFVKRKQIPIGYTQTDHIYTVQFSKTQQNKVLFVGPPGIGKTKLIMRFVYYLHLMGWKIIIFNPKGGEYIDVNESMHPRRLLQGEIQLPIPVENLIPSFAVADTPPSLRAKMTEFSPKIGDLKTEHELRTLKFKYKGAEFIMDQIRNNKGKITIQELLHSAEKALRRKELHFTAFQSLKGTLKHLETYAFFDSDAADFYVLKSWRAGNIPVINSFVDTEEENGFIFSKIINSAYFKFTTFKKIIIVDDCQTFFPAGRAKEDSISLHTMSQRILPKGRSTGWDVFLTSQFPELVHDDILRNMAGLGYKIFGRIDIGDTLVKALGNKNIQRIVHRLKSNIKLHQYPVAMVEPHNLNPTIVDLLGPPMCHPSNMIRGKERDAN